MVGELSTNRVRAHGRAAEWNISSSRSPHAPPPDLASAGCNATPTHFGICLFAFPGASRLLSAPDSTTSPLPADRFRADVPFASTRIFCAPIAPIAPIVSVALGCLDGLSQVGSSLGHCQRAPISLHLRRQGRHRPVYLDSEQRHQEGGWAGPQWVRASGGEVANHALGRRIKLQHLFLQRRRQRSTRSRPERAQEAANIETPGRYQGSGHCRGGLPRYRGWRDTPRLKPLFRRKPIYTSLPSASFP